MFLVEDNIFTSIVLSTCVSCELIDLTTAIGRLPGQKPALDYLLNG